MTENNVARFCSVWFPILEFLMQKDHNTLKKIIN